MPSRLMSALATRLRDLRTASKNVWLRYRRLSTAKQVMLAVIFLIALLGGGTFLAHLKSTPPLAETLPTVSLARISELSTGGASVGVIGSVRSITEASILAESGGTVRAVHTHVGASVPAGYVIAELDNASQRAAVLQAEGVYDSAVAARSGSSIGDIGASAVNTYVSSYNSLDSILKTYVDTFYGDPGAFGPIFLISSGTFDLSYFSRQRAALAQTMDTWHTHLATASSANATDLLNEADAGVTQAAALITDIASVAARHGTDANATQLAALATARSSVATLQASVATAKQTYRGQGTAATAGADASVKTALGSLRGAQANLEKTLVRAPIAGQVNFLPIRVGDYVTAYTHVATVAQNGALEIVAYVSEDTRSHLSVGTHVTIEDTYPGIITSIAPALDPTTKQIEVHVAVTGTSSLVNGQSVRIALPSDAITSSTASSTGPILLPLTALKLTPNARVVFSLGEDGRLIAHPVEIGDVHGDQIEITTPLPGDLRIVVDARGRSEGEKVNVAP